MVEFSLRKPLMMLDKAPRAAVVLLLLIAERPAYAYIDPGTGSLIYQTALDGAAGARRSCCGAAASRSAASSGGSAAGTPRSDFPGAEPRD